MNISLNNQSIRLPENTTISDLIQQVGATAPFAVSVNTVFIPRQSYDTTILHEHDKVDIVQAVAGG